MNVLVLNLDSEYFDEILSGKKKEEYREVKDYWNKRLAKPYDIIEFRKGYPKKDDYSRIIRYKYLGCSVKRIVHKKFNNIPTKVYVIKIGERIMNEQG